MENNQPYQPGNSLPPQPASYGQQPLPASHSIGYTDRFSGSAVSGSHASGQPQPQYVQQPAYSQQAYYPPQGQPYQTPQPATQQPVQTHSGPGRIGRLGFLLGWVYIFGVMVAHIALLFAIGLMGIVPDDPSGAFVRTFNIFNILLNLGEWVLIIVGGILLAIRRLHDLNTSGWATLLYFVPLVGIFLMLYLFFAPSKEPNGYGPPLTSRNFWVVLGFKKPKHAH